MTALLNAARQALEALACCRDMVAHPDNLEFIDQKITALRQAIEQAEQQEPVAWYCKEGLKRGVSLKQEGPEWIPLYTKKLP